MHCHQGGAAATWRTGARTPPLLVRRVLLAGCSLAGCSRTVDALLRRRCESCDCLLMRLCHSLLVSERDWLFVACTRVGLCAVDMHCRGGAAVDGCGCTAERRCSCAGGVRAPRLLVRQCHVCKSTHTVKVQDRHCSFMYSLPSYTPSCTPHLHTPTKMLR